MRITSFFAALSIVAACSKPAPSVAVTADGSSTVYPLTEAAAELFQKSSNATVNVAFSGTVIGFGKFCRGQLDILDASRPINRQEQDLCAQQQVAFVELPVAHDALTIIVNAWNTWAKYLLGFPFTTECKACLKLAMVLSDTVSRTWTMVRAKVFALVTSPYCSKSL